MHSARILRAAIALALFATLSMGACGESNSDGVKQAQVCDTEAACPSNQFCCRETENAPTGVCQRACQCISDADCGYLAVSVTNPVCCHGACFSNRFELSCLDNADCPLGKTCDFSGDFVPVTYGSLAFCYGYCIDGGGAGGAGGDGSSTTTSSTTGGGGAGGAAGLAPYTIIAGTPTAEGDCLEATGASASPVLIALDETITGPVTLVVGGVLTPIAGGGGITPVALVQAGGGGLVNGGTVEGASLARVSQSTLDNSGSVEIYNTTFGQVASDTWVPTTTQHVYRASVSYDIDGVTSTVEMTEIVLEIDGVVVSTLNATALGPASGDRLSLTISEATVCELLVIQ